MTFFIFLVLLYLYLFNPFLTILGGVGGIKIIYLFIIVFFFSNSAIRKRVTRNKSIVFIFCLIIAYCIFQGLIGRGYIALRSNVVSFIECLIIPLFLIEFKNKYLSKKNISYSLLITCSIASAISVVALFSPSFNTFLNTTIQIPTEVQQNVLFRGYGLGGELTFGYGMVQGIMAGYILLDKNHNLKIGYFIIPLLLLSAIVNARIGVLVAGISFLIYILTSPKKIFKNFYLVIILGAGFYLSYYLIGYLSNETKYFIEQFVLEVKDIFLGTSDAKNSTANTLTGEMIFFPKTIGGWIFGEGIDVYGESLTQRSDVGYIRDIMFAGVLFLLLKFLAAYSFIKKGWVAKMDKWLLLYFIVAILLGQLKGEMLLNSAGFRLICLFILLEVDTIIHKKENQNCFNE